MGEMTLEVMVEVMMEVRAEVMEEVIVAMEVLLPEALECWVTFLCFSTILPFSPPLSSPPFPPPTPLLSHCREFLSKGNMMGWITD